MQSWREAQGARPHPVKGGPPRTPVRDPSSRRARSRHRPSPEPLGLPSHPGRVSLGPQRLRLAEVARSFFLFSCLVELKSDREKSGAGLRPGRLGLTAPGAIPAGGAPAGPAKGAGGQTPREQTALSTGKAGEGINCRGGEGEGARESRVTPDSSERVPPAPAGRGGGPANPLRERKLIAAAREGRIKASVDPHPPAPESCYLLLN